MKGTETSEDLPAAALRALQQGRKIEAIKALRDARNLGLKEAKEHLEAYLAANPHAHRAIPKADRGIRRLLVVLMILVSACLLMRHFY